MAEDVNTGTGWRPMPIPLKALFVVLLLWSLGAVMNAPNLMENGLPLLGTFVYGIAAFAVVLALDIIGPLVFLYALWTRKSWAVMWAFIYIGLFIVNGAVAFLTVREQLGLPQIAVPVLVSVIFLAVIYWQRRYFSPTR